MLAFDILPEVLYKPNRAFKDLKGNVDSRDGVIMWLLVSIIALLLFGVSASVLGITIVPISFGFESLEPLEIITGIIKGIIVLGLLAAFATKLAVKLGGQGSFSETLGMLGYSKMLAVPQSVAAAVFVVLMVLRAQWISETYMAGSAITAGEIFGPFIPVLMVVIIIFLVWFFWITGTALSVAHNISFARGLGAVLISYFIIQILFSFVGILTGHSIMPYF